APPRSPAGPPPPFRGPNSGPASIRHTVRSSFSDSLDARTQPAVPPPTTTTSKLTSAEDRPGGTLRQGEPLDVFSARTREWFERAFAAATPAQALGWPAIAKGSHVLIQAPTGSGKTLAAFLIGIDRLDRSAGDGLRLLYVSPLKALNYDVERNLRSPLAGIGSRLSVGVRTGDTPAEERAAMLRNPPDILITTPESLFLLLTSRARETRGPTR